MLGQGVNGNYFDFYKMEEKRDNGLFFEFFDEDLDMFRRIS